MSNLVKTGLIQDFWFNLEIMSPGAWTHQRGSFDMATLDSSDLPEVLDTSNMGSVS